MQQLAWQGSCCPSPTPESRSPPSMLRITDSIPVFPSGTGMGKDGYSRAIKDLLSNFLRTVKIKSRPSIVSPSLAMIFVSGRYSSKGRHCPCSASSDSARPIQEEIIVSDNSSLLVTKWVYRGSKLLRHRYLVSEFPASCGTNYMEV